MNRQHAYYSRFSCSLLVCFSTSFTGVPETELRRCRLLPPPPRGSPAGVAPPPPLRTGAYANPPTHDAFIPGDVVSVEFHREAAAGGSSPRVKAAAATANPIAARAAKPLRELARVCSEDLHGQAAFVVGENHSFDANALGLRLVRQLAWRGAQVACSVPGPVLPTSLVALQRAGRVVVAIALNGEAENPSWSKRHPQNQGGGGGSDGNSSSSTSLEPGLVGHLRRAGMGQLNLVLMLPPELAPDPHLLPTPLAGAAGAGSAAAAAAGSATVTTNRAAAHDGLLGLGALELERSLQNAFDQHAVAPVSAVVALHNQGLLCTGVGNYKGIGEKGASRAGTNAAGAAVSSSNAAASSVCCRVGVLVPDLTDPLRPWCGDVGLDNGAMFASSTGDGGSSSSTGGAGTSLVGHLASHRVGRAALLMGVRLLGHELSEATNGAVCVAALSPTVQSEEVFVGTPSSGSDGDSYHGATKESSNPRAVADKLVSALAGLKVHDAGGLIRADGTVLNPA